MEGMWRRLIAGVSAPMLSKQIEPAISTKLISAHPLMSFLTLYDLPVRLGMG
jgi:hypothetical protein